MGSRFNVRFRVAAVRRFAAVATQLKAEKLNLNANEEPTPNEEPMNRTPNPEPNLMNPMHRMNLHEPTAALECIGRLGQSSLGVGETLDRGVEPALVGCYQRQ